MFWLQAAQAPIVTIVTDGKTYTMLSIPRFLMDDITDWAAQLQEKHLAKVTEKMDEIKKREFMQVYPPVPPDIQQIRNLVRTHEGTTYVLEKQLPLAKRWAVDKAGKRLTQEDLPNMTLDEVRQLIKMNGFGRAASLAWFVADLEDASIDNNPFAKESRQEEGGDPLTGSGKRDSKE